MGLFLLLFNVLTNVNYPFCRQEIKIGVYQWKVTESRKSLEAAVILTKLVGGQLWLCDLAAQGEKIMAMLTCKDVCTISVILESIIACAKLLNVFLMMSFFTYLNIYPKLIKILYCQIFWMNKIITGFICFKAVNHSRHLSCLHINSSEFFIRFY